MLGASRVRHSIIVPLAFSTQGFCALLGRNVVSEPEIDINCR